MVHLEAKKLGLRGLRAEELPKLGIVLKTALALHNPAYHSGLSHYIGPHTGFRRRLWHHCLRRGRLPQSG